ncbi:MAG TPA: cobalamin-binding protein [Thermoplasmata archaeon]|nr:cobalamin-binding protein [Thermoplasmata archaeon]
MAMEKKGQWAILLVVCVVASSAASFAGGYYVGETNSSGPDGGLVIVDDYGRTVSLESIPTRIVSAAPTPTEILFAVGAGDLVVGIDEYSDYPEGIGNLTRVGAYPLNLEVVIGLNPDLIISSDLVPADQLENLEAQGIPYMILAARTLEDVMGDIRLVGIVTGHIDEAEALAGSLEARIETITEKTLALDVEKPRVYLEYFPYWTYGPGSFGDNLIALAGGINIAENASSEYPLLTSEFVIAQDPEIIIFTIGYMTSTNAEEISSRSGWDGITAVSGDQIYSIDDNLVSRYGPRIVDGLEQLAELIHPELFA